MRILVAAVVAVSVVGIGGHQDGVQAAPCQTGQMEPPFAVRGHKSRYTAQGYKAQGYKGQGYKGQAYKGQGYKGQGYKGQGRGFLDSCRWLRARALTSHNPVWMQRYKACKAG